MEPSTLAEIFYFVMTAAAIIIAAAIAFVAYHVYSILKKVEIIGERFADGIGAFEELIKKFSFFKKTERIRRKSKRAAEEA